MTPRTLIAFSIAASCLLGLASSAWAAETIAGESTFTLNAWEKDFTAALKENNSQKFLQLLDLEKLTKEALSCRDCSVKSNLEKARALFAKKQFEESLNLYSQIPKGHDYWFQAIEEKGWAYFRQNNFEQAIAQSKTLLSPQFAEVVNSESYFLQSLSQLKICDYKGVFTTHELFKEKQKSRILEVQKLAQTGSNEAFGKVIRSVQSFPLKRKELSDSFLHLPVLYYKDLELQRELLKFRISESALKILQAEQNTMQKLKTSLEKLNSSSLLKMKSRLATLAKIETEENKKIIQKLNLIEVEAIQRIHTDLALSKENYSQGKFRTAGEDQLVFMDDGHPWIDELDKFEVAAKACAQNIRRKM